MDILKVLAGASATVLAALIAAAITFLVSVFTKESKTSEFRQGWIELLRNDLAQFVGTWWHLINEFDRAKRTPNLFDSPDFWLSLKPELLKVEELQTRIELRLNPKEHVELIAQIRRLGGAHDFVGTEFKEKKAAFDQLVAESQRVLKGEWRRVKEGEWTYRWVKRISFVALLLAAAVVCVVVLENGHMPG
jgi:hypothetical protein